MASGYLCRVTNAMSGADFQLSDSAPLSMDCIMGHIRRWGLSGDITILVESKNPPEQCQTIHLMEKNVKLVVYATLTPNVKFSKGADGPSLESSDMMAQRLERHVYSLSILLEFLQISLGSTQDLFKEKICTLKTQLQEFKDSLARLAQDPSIPNEIERNAAVCRTVIKNVEDHIATKERQGCKNFDLLASLRDTNNRLLPTKSDIRRIVETVSRDPDSSAVDDCSADIKKKILDALTSFTILKDTKSFCDAMETMKKLSAQKFETILFAVKHPKVTEAYQEELAKRTRFLKMVQQQVDALKETLTKQSEVEYDRQTTFNEQFSQSMKTHWNLPPEVPQFIVDLQKPCSVARPQFEKTRPDTTCTVMKLHEETNRLKEEHTNTTKQLHEKEEQVRDLETELSRLRAQVEAVTAEKTELLAQVAQIRTENTGLNTDNAKLRAEKVRLQDENLKLKNENGMLKAENVKYLDENTKYLAENTKYLAENTSCADEISRIRKENDVMKAENARLNGEVSREKQEREAQVNGLKVLNEASLSLLKFSVPLAGFLANHHCFVVKLDKLFFIAAPATNVVYIIEPFSAAKFDNMSLQRINVGGVTVGFSVGHATGKQISCAPEKYHLPGTVSVFEVAVDPLEFS